MKNRSWLNITEYLMLIGSGMGSIATAVSQQALYTAAPVSALLVLNLLNHRRIAQSAESNTAIAVLELDQKLSHTLSILQQQIHALPSPIHLASLRKDLQSQHQQAFMELSQTMQQLQREIPQAEWQLLPQAINQLRKQYGALAETVVDVKESLNRLSSTHRVETIETDVGQLKAELAQLRTQLQGISSDHKLSNYRALQDQISHLNRRFNKLPAQVDASGLEQDIESLIKVVGDMASRRDLVRVEVQLEKLTRQHHGTEQVVAPLKVAILMFKKQLDAIALRLNSPEKSAQSLSESAPPNPDLTVITKLMTTVTALEARVNQLPDLAHLSASTDLTSLRTELEHLVITHLGPLQQQLNAVQQQTQELEHQQQTLQDWVHRLPQLLDASTSEVRYLATRVEWAESNVIDLQTQMEAIRGPMPNHELVFDLQSSGLEPIQRSMLEDALAQVQARLILVLPFPRPETLDEAMFERFRQFLNRNGCLDIGWGHLGEGSVNGISPWKMHRSRLIDPRCTVNPASHQFLADTLNRLTELKKEYPERLRFKVLGTDESFLVCDRAFAILGIPSVATTSAVFPTAAVGLRTTEPDVIQQLVTRFDQPVLKTQDVAAYFNRAETRYDLGDRQGAISDYTEVLTIHPTDDVAYNNRGLAHYNLGNPDNALQDFDHALHHNPQNVAAFCNRGMILAESGAKLDAINDYTQAIQLHPECTTAYFHRGVAHTHLQNRLEAIQDYSQVIRLTPQDAAAYFYRGLAAAKSGQTLEAVQDLRRAAQLFAAQGDSANYRQALNTLKKLQKTLVMDSSGKSLVANKVG